MKNKPTLSVIIVSWNVKDLLRRSLKSLFETNQSGVHFEVVVVDNASRDGSAEMVSYEFPNVKLIANRENVGFAKACNQGSQIADGDYFLFLNDDTEVFADSLSEPVKYLASNKEIGVLGCSIKNPNNTQQPSVRHFPKLIDQLLILLKIHNFFPGFIRKYLCIKFDYSVSQSVEQVMGAYFLVPRSVFFEIGGFDEKFYFWFEEVDFCRRVKKTGKQIWYFADTKIIHQGGSSFKQWSALPEQKLFNNSLLYYFSKHHAGWEVLLLKLFMPLSYVLAGLVGLMERINLNPKNKK